MNVLFIEEFDKKYKQAKEDKANGLVECDLSCKAKEEPETLEEYKATLEHYREHPYLSGCSHGC